MRWRLASALIAAALGTPACAPLPVDVPLTSIAADRPKIVGLARDGVVAQVAVVDPTRPVASQLPAVIDARDDETVEIVVITLASSLNALGLASGLYEETAATNEGAVASYAGRAVSVEKATVVAGELSSFSPASVPAWLSTFRIPVAQPCVDLRATTLPDLPAPATFVVSLADGRALVGTRANAGANLFIVGPDDPQRRVEVVLDQPPEVTGSQLYAMGALPASDSANTVWLSMRFGELWRVTLRSDGAPIVPDRRVPTGLDSGLGFVHGRASGDQVSLYGLAPAGPLVHFDGARAQTLHDFGRASYFSGGITEDEDGTVIAARTSAGEAVGVVDGRARVFPVDGSRDGLTAIARIASVGVVLSDGRGQIYRRMGDAFVPLVDLGIPTGAQALVATDSGFLGAGGSGLTREWRTNAGLCPPPEAPLVGQTLRYWTRFQGGWLVSGPERDGATALEAALTLFTP